MNLLKQIRALSVLISCSAAVAQLQIHVTAPNGGEVWWSNDPHNITWTSNCGGNVWIELYRGSDFNRLLCESTPNNGSYLWIMPDNIAEGANYRVRIVSLEIDTITVDDWSDEPFRIRIPPHISLLSPNGGEDWVTGSYHPIIWTDNIVDHLRIDLWRTDSFFCEITPDVANTGTYTWHIPASIPEGIDYRVCIQSRADSTVADKSDTTFTIEWPPSLRLRTPNGGETWVVGDTNLVLWNSIHLGGDSVRIDLKRNYPAGSWSILTASTPDTGSFRWMVTEPVTSNARMRIRGVSRPAVGDTSDSEFSIANTLQAPVAVLYRNQNGWTLAWQPVGGARGYRVWNSSMVSGNYALFAMTSDTSLVIEDTSFRKQFFQVVATH